jgi:hypothetical protein
MAGTSGPRSTPLYQAGECAEAADLRRAIDTSDGFARTQRTDSDFDPIRDEPAFKELIGR